jgi:hypothetical protein
MAGLIEPVKPARDMTDEIVRSVRKSVARSRFVRALEAIGALAAAACIILALQFGGPDETVEESPVGPTSGIEAKIASILKDIPEEDRFIVQNLQLFDKYDEVSHYRQVRDIADAETISALAMIEE